MFKSQRVKTISLKYHLPCGMKNLKYLTIHILDKKLPWQNNMHLKQSISDYHELCNIIGYSLLLENMNSDSWKITCCFKIETVS